MFTPVGRKVAGLWDMHKSCWTCCSRFTEPYLVLALFLSWPGIGFSVPRKTGGPTLGIEACDGFSAFHMIYFIICFSFA